MSDSSRRRIGSALQGASEGLGMWAQMAGKKEMMAADHQYQITMANLRQKNGIEMVGVREESEKNLITERGIVQSDIDDHRSDLRETENAANFGRQQQRDTTLHTNALERIDAQGRKKIEETLARVGGVNEGKRLTDLTKRERKLYDDYKADLGKIVERGHENKVTPEQKVQEMNQLLARIQQSPDVRNNPVFRAQTSLLLADHLDRVESYLPMNAEEGSDPVDPTDMAWALRKDAATLLHGPEQTHDEDVPVEDLVPAVDDGSFADIPGAQAQPVGGDLIAPQAQAAQADVLPQAPIAPSMAGNQQNPQLGYPSVSDFTDLIPSGGSNVNPMGRQRPSVLPNGDQDLIAGR